MYLLLFFFLDELIKDQALKYMAVLVDGDQLYKEALATYDLHLTLMVAHRSQKVRLESIFLFVIIYKSKSIIFI